MNIRGTEGLSPADLQSEIARGARFVSYQWCLSLLVVTLKRDTRLHYLRPGETGFLPGFLWSAFSLVGGWWGIPWGPIYTIGSLWTNLRGGIDVTAAVSAELAADHGAPAVPPLAGVGLGAPRWSAGPLAALGVFAAAIFALVAGANYQAQQHRPVALANGLDSAYVAEIDGTAHPLRPRSVVQLELPAGAHTVVATLPGGNGPTRFTFTAGGATVAVINPDGAALVAEETSIYSAQADAAGENPAPRVHAGRTAYSLPRPDYFLDEFPGSVSMPRHASRTEKSRVAVHTDLTYERTADVLLRLSGRPALVAYFKALGARLPDDTRLLAAAADALTPAELDDFFTAHLTTRPVRVEWHRAYQNFRRAQHPDTDLAADYRRLAEANPDDGAFAYLHGRLLDNPVEDAAWFERALAAPRPCAHAHFALAYNAVARGDFAGALAGLERARAAGLDNDTVRDQRIECLLALGRPVEALQALRETPAARADFARANDELHLAFLTGGKPAATQVVEAFLARLPADVRKESGPAIRKNFAARVAYFEGDTKAFAESLPAEPDGLAAVTRALCVRDHTTAACIALDQEPETEKSVGYLFLYLSACLEKDPGAEDFWRSLVATWSKIDNRHACLAAHFQGTARLTETALLDLPFSPSEKRLVLTAIGLHEPALRAAAFARARQCNFSREFPHHLVAAALASAQP